MEPTPKFTHVLLQKVCTKFIYIYSIYNALIRFCPSAVPQLQDIFTLPPHVTYRCLTCHISCADGCGRCHLLRNGEFLCSFGHPQAQASNHRISWPFGHFFLNEISYAATLLSPRHFFTCANLRPADSAARTTMPKPSSEKRQSAAIPFPHGRNTEAAFKENSKVK